MDLSILSATLQIVQLLYQAAQGLVIAAQNLAEGPAKIKQLEGLFDDLIRHRNSAKQKYANKLHHVEMELLISSIDTLIQQVDPLMKRAKRLASKKKKGVSKYVAVLRNAITGDDMAEVANSIKIQLSIWLDRQTIASDIRDIMKSTAQGLPNHLKVQPVVGYEPVAKAERIRALLQNSHHKVILIHGLSGMGKSCLARHVAANPPEQFSDGAMELILGQGCSRESCGNDAVEYKRRLAGRFAVLLQSLGHKWDEVKDIEVDHACQMIQDALIGKSILILLQDVWEPDIITRFNRLYDNECKYIATTRIKSVVENTEADKVELSKEDVEHLSIPILMLHSQLSLEEIPDIADELSERCGYHPLTLAVIGKALQGETRPEQWERAIDDLQTYAAQGPVPLAYLDEKEAESAATVFGSFDYSLRTMSTYARELFATFSALDWKEPIPEACLETMWLTLGQDSTFRLVAGKLLEGSLLDRANSEMHYCIHDMVALYLDTKFEQAMNLLFIASDPMMHAAVIPWLFRYGTKVANEKAEWAIREIMKSADETMRAMVLWNMFDVLCASNTITELDNICRNFTNLIVQGVANLFSKDYEDLSAAAARCIACCFTTNDYKCYASRLIQAGAIDNLVSLLKTHYDSHVRRDSAAVLACLAEFRNNSSFLQEIPIEEIIELLDPYSEETHEVVINALMRLAQTGQQIAIEHFFKAGMDKKLEDMLERGSERAQRKAIIALKSFHELGGSSAVYNFLGSGILSRVPWQARLTLEKLTRMERHPSYKKVPKRQSVMELIQKFMRGSEEEQIEAIQDLIPIVERADNLQVREVILSTSLIGFFGSILDNPVLDHRVKSETAVALVKLCSSGGDQCIQSMLNARVLESLVGMMKTTQPEVQEFSYTTFHSLIGIGKRQVSDRLLQKGLIDELVVLIKHDSQTSKELGLLFIQDLVEIGGKECTDKLLSCKIVEKLVILSEDINFKNVVFNFVRSIYKCGGLSTTESKVLSQQIQRQARNALKDASQLRKLNSLLREFARHNEGSGSSRRSEGSIRSRASFS